MSTSAHPSSSPTAEPYETPDNVENFDYVLNSVSPLNLMKFWQLPRYSNLQKRAIDCTLRPSSPTPAKSSSNSKRASGSISTSPSSAAALVSTSPTSVRSATQAGR
ncbi:hypothetical protein BDW02DRAFT_593571 [Decorospora gaudefroyi]|uniref:Uncharacterized protein n=1 Tax=Decorospora gaudefroyi TaxID=184978 RepID=A0A6A5KQZ7_9PLEO|nr:hypothetical protein BDW02DRAFT_593571 [Decorospora gaudefroyi]